MNNLKKGDWFIDKIGNVGKIIRDVDSEGYTTALMGDDAKRGKGIGHQVNIKFLTPYTAKENRAKQFINNVSEMASKKWDFYHEYLLDKKAGSYSVGDLAYNYDYTDKALNVGYIELELPIKEIDKDSLQGVSVRIPFHVNSMSIYNDDGLHVEPAIKSSLPDKYISVSTGKETEFDSNQDKDKVHKYIIANKSSIETAIEDFISDEMIAKIERERDAI